MSLARDSATQFARALDAEDYQAAEAMLSEQCEYTCRNQVYRGPAAIIASYRCAGDTAQRDFDSIQYESRIVECTGRTARIEFLDHLSHRGQRFTFQCQQLIEVDEAGLITRIEHRDLPGQREALSEFKQQAGLFESNKLQGKSR